MASKKNKVIFCIFILLVFTLAGAAYFFVDQFILYTQTSAHPDAQDKLFTILPGQNLKTIARNLEKNAIISNDTYFIWFAKLKKADTHLQAGEYLLSASKSPKQIIDLFLKGKVKLHRLTFPEGMTIKEMANLLETAGLCSQIEIVSLCYNRSFIESLSIPSLPPEAESLEGYLFPDTYFFPKNADCRTILATMVTRFKSVFTPEWEHRSNELGFSAFEIITLASMVEKETGDASERPLIASVFHNRLKKNMRLESDPTVIYGIQKFDGNIKRKHLKMITPYNTYQIQGLPAGPIANPGKLSIQAALYPAQTPYLFFVSKKDTTHYFSKTIQEHNQAVRKYQLNK
ncbi:MAG: endolytic transglycosylase MltG [Pseudomonadota bacterium]